MSARDTLLEIVRQWTSRNGGAPETPEAVVEASESELLRAWAAKVREVGAAKGWSVWAAAFMDPDVPFVDTDMPSTETIVAELRRLDRADALERFADEINALGDDHELGPGWGDAADRARSKAASLRREKDTSGGHQPAEGESTPEAGSQDTGTTFAKWLRDARIASGLSQQRIADAVTEQGLRFLQTTIAKIERGSRPMRLDEAVVLTQLFGTTLDAVLNLREGSRISFGSREAARRASLLAHIRDQIDAELKGAAPADEPSRAINELCRWAADAPAHDTDSEGTSQ
ncbi:helix-turn-helix transcriptional regulator [Streptomyces sp. 3214.6]|uniref:helix-turn-helix transcriptional regulator n=1 Tax=Streptomyces sp. 3214.6 TaxID=1882757 RepID=UPI00090B5071|nr:helix-turn-helix transcriptional regulator [Streptomyces sp. 3214.6]SHI67129.1 hypothetical protein SAMN05444521_8194 [Streptomyces sp. 3214.6]